jgi:hypothetical protein
MLVGAGAFIATLGLVILGMFGVYQAAIAAWIATAMIGFAIAWRVPALEAVAAMSAVLVGIAMGLLSLDIRYNPQNVVVVMNPLEQLLAWASGMLMPEGTVTLSGLVHSLVNGIGTVLATRTLVLDSSARPTIFLEWFVVAAAIVAWKAGHRRRKLRCSCAWLGAWIRFTPFEA